LFPLRVNGHIGGFLSPAQTVATPDFRAKTLITPDQHQLRAGVWSMPGHTGRAICVLLNGHTEFMEKYGEVAGDLCARGFEVASLDWRGQGASERRVYGNRAGHVGHFEEYDMDLAALMLQVVEPIQRALPSPLPLVALGHSMGGHNLLRYLHDHPRRFLCAVLCAPMIDINTGKYSPTVAQLLAWILNLYRPSKRAIFGIERRDPLELRFEENVVTSDRSRFERNQNLLRQQPFLRISGPTFGWLGAAFQSIRRMRRRRFAADILTPVLVFGAGHDTVVRSEAIRALCRRLPNARYIEIEGARHEILMENDAIRAEFWREFDAFMDVHLPRA
jgi:lysophospholipase